MPQIDHRQIRRIRFGTALAKNRRSDQSRARRTRRLSSRAHTSSKCPDRLRAERCVGVMSACILNPLRSQRAPSISRLSRALPQRLGHKVGTSNGLRSIGGVDAGDGTLEAFATMTCHQDTTGRPGFERVFASRSARSMPRNLRRALRCRSERSTDPAASQPKLQRLFAVFAAATTLTPKPVRSRSINARAHPRRPRPTAPDAASLAAYSASCAWRASPGSASLGAQAWQAAA